MKEIIFALRRVNRFLAEQLLFPILLSSLFAFTLFAGRVFISRELTYKNLVWNLLLAWIPYLFSLAAAILHMRFPRGWWLLLLPAFFWMLFFPNAPYIVTDFLHLHERQGVPIWFDIGMLATFAWTGVFLAIASLRTMQVLVKEYLGWIVSWLFAGYALFMGGLGIYLGRFERWNSWDLFLHPRAILVDIATRFIHPMSNLRFFGFTLLFAAFLLICYLTFISVRWVGESEFSRRRKPPSPPQLAEFEDESRGV